MSRRFAPFALMISFPILALAGDDPATLARDLGKKLASVAKITDAQIRPLLATDNA